MNDNMNNRYSRRHNPSLFGPIVMIAIGGYFLLHNLGILPQINWNWGALVQLWPLWLVFIGLNIIVRQAPRPLGSFFSALVGFLAIGCIGYVLMFGEDNRLLTRLGMQNQMTLQTEEISFPRDDVTAADITLSLWLPETRVTALEDSRALIAGTVTYAGELQFDTSHSGNLATVELGVEQGGWEWFINPENWDSFEDVDAWEIGLNPRVATDLDVNLGLGAADLSLQALTLSQLVVDGGAGSAEVHLPEGDYEMEINVGAGSVRLWLSENGRQSLDIDGGAGSVTIYLPEGMAARIEVNDGAGSFSADRRFDQINGSSSEDGVWETADFDAAADQITININIGAGSVRIVEP